MQPLDDTAKPARFSWGPVILLALQGTVWVLLYQNQIPTGEPVSAPALGLMAVTGGVVFLLVRRWQNSLWGLVAAFLLVLHRVYAVTVAEAGAPLWTEFVELLALMCVVGIWYHAFQPRLHLLALFGFILVLLLASALGWLTSPHSGWVATLLAGTGLLLAALLAGTSPGPAAKSARVVHGIVVGLFGVAIPVCCVLLAAPFLEAAQWFNQHGPDSFLRVPIQPGLTPGCSAAALVETAFRPQFGSDLAPGFTPDEWSAWAWPQPVVVLVLMTLGLYRSVRRGWSLWRKGQAPLPWVLTLFPLIVFLAGVLNPESVRQAHYLPLASLSVLLAVFGVGDSLWGFGEAIRLAPPGEQEEAALS